MIRIVFALIVLIMFLPTGVFSMDGTFADVASRAKRDVHENVTLSFRQQAIVKLAALSAIGSDQYLRDAIEAALKAEHLVQKDVVLILTQLTSYYGFPKAQRAFKALSGLVDVSMSIQLPKDDMPTRHASGKSSYTALDPKGYDMITRGFGPLANNLPNTTFPLFGDAYSPIGLTLQDRQLSTISALTAMDTAEPQLRFHIGTSLRVGLTQKNIMDMIVLIQYYAGMPAAYNGAIAAKAVFETTERSDS